MKIPRMAQVPLRMAQPGLVPPHQQRPPMMVSMTQPPPVSMQGLVSMAPMMGPGGGMAVMTQAMSHHESVHEHHTMNSPYHHHHHHHHHPHHPPRPHGPSQGHHAVPPPPPHPSGPPQPPPHSAPPHTQYHPHPGAPHHVPHSHHNGPHSVHHSGPHSASHSHSAPLPPPPHMTNHSSSSSSNTHNTHVHPQPHLQSAPPPPHMSQPSHSMQHHTPHQMTGTMNTNQHHSQAPHHHQHHTPHPQHHTPHPQHHHQAMHQPMQHTQVPQQQPPPPPPPLPQQHLHPNTPHLPQHPVLSQPPQQQHPPVPQSVETGGGTAVGGMIAPPPCTTNHIVTTSTTVSGGAPPPTIAVGANGIATNRSPPVVGATLSSSSGEASSVSTREKTPMCLINELARYNKISHQYCLTDEKGPAHKKVFTVTLKLGNSEEEYSASGPSIKKAQHSAAALSLDKTKFKHPPPKAQRQNKQTKLTPTVELNALAMKRGEAAIYTFMEPPRTPSPYAHYVPPNLRTVYNQPKFYGRPPVYPMFFVTLQVGNRVFEGEGATAQQAKHNAASKALKIIKALPMPETSSAAGAQIAANSAVGNGGSPASSAVAGGGAAAGDLDPNADLKSPISLVHEIALKRNLTVSFEVVRESGPPHMRTFATTCSVGEHRTQGEGTGKKVSKKRAAELMLEELRQLPPVSTAPVTRVKRKPTAKKKGRNLIKVGQEEQKATPEYGQGINPISRLIQIQQAKKEKEPIYTLVAERGVPRRREFVMQVIVGANTAQGNGPNKKLAKRAAAESMLQLLGYSRPQPQPTKPAIKMDGAASHSDADKTRKQVTFLEESDCSRVSGSDPVQCSSSIPAGGGRQLVPGLIMMQDGMALRGSYNKQCQQSNVNSVNMSQMVNMQATAAIAKELLESGSSATAKALSKTQTNGTPSTTQTHASTHQLNTVVSQPTIVHQQANNVSSPQAPLQPHAITHQPILQRSVPPQLQNGAQQQQQQQQQNVVGHTQIQTSPSANVNMTVSNNTSSTNSNNNIIPNNTNINNNNNNNNTNSNTTRSGGLTMSGTTTGPVVRPKDQLLYLANIFNLQVQFTDFPKGTKSEYLSLVSLTTTPPHVTHGAGPTIDASHDQACLTALRALAEMDLDSMTCGAASAVTSTSKSN